MIRPIAGSIYTPSPHRAQPTAELCPRHSRLRVARGSTTTEVRGQKIHILIGPPV